MRHLAAIVACAWGLALVGAESAQAETYAVLVGINDYRYFGVRDLRYSESDVELMRDTLTRYCGVPAENMRVLLGRAATRREIGLAIRVWLAEVAGPDDRVLFYFAGHGTQLQDDNGDEEDGLDEALWAWDTGVLDLTWVRDDDLNRWMSFVKAREKVVILDCCHSGTGSRFLGENRVRSASIPASEVRIASLESKLAAEHAIEGGGSVASPADVSVFTTPGVGDAVAEFAACRPHQLVVETAQYEHGALTYFLTEGLRGAADDNADGVITLGELQTYSARRIREHGFPQEPQLYGPDASLFALVEGPPPAMRGATAEVVEKTVVAGREPAWAAVSPYLHIAVDDAAGGAGSTGGGRFGRLTDALAELPGVRVGGVGAPDVVVMATPNSGPEGGIVVRTTNPLTGESGPMWELVSDADVSVCAAGLLPLMRAASVRKALLAIENIDSPYRIRQTAAGAATRVAADGAGKLVALSVAADGQLTILAGGSGALLVDAPVAPEARRKVVALASREALSTLVDSSVVNAEDAWETLRQVREELAAMDTETWGAVAILATPASGR